MVRTATYGNSTIRLVHEKDVSVRIDNIRDLIKVKYTGELAGVAFYLPTAHEWLVANDSAGNLCLLPRKKDVAPTNELEEEEEL